MWILLCTWISGIIGPLQLLFPSWKFDPPALPSRLWFYFGLLFANIANKVGVKDTLTQLMTQRKLLDPYSTTPWVGYYIRYSDLTLTIFTKKLNNITIKIGMRIKVIGQCCSSTQTMTYYNQHHLSPVSSRRSDQEEKKDASKQLNLTNQDILLILKCIQKSILTLLSNL